jgi:chromosome segregation ATPase
MSYSSSSLENSGLRLERDRYKEQAQERLVQLNDAQAKLTDLGKEFDGLKSDLGLREKELRASEDLRERSVREIQDLSSRLAAKDRALRAAEAKAAALEKSVTKTAPRRQTSIVGEESLRWENQRLRSRLESLEARLSARPDARAVALLQEEIERLEDNLASYRAEAEAFRVQRDVAKSEARSSRDQAVSAMRETAKFYTALEKVTHEPQMQGDACGYCGSVNKEAPQHQTPSRVNAAQDVGRDS